MVEINYIVWVLFVFLSFFIGKGVVRQLKKLKKFQTIYELSPDSHQTKQGTPTMGGIMLILIISGGIIFFRLFDPIVLWIWSCLVLFAGIGFYDDLKSIQNKKNQGLTSKQKFLLQLFFAVILLGIYYWFINPFSISLGLLYLFAMVGTSNATNLTDGVDGLLGTLSLVTLLGFFGLFFIIQQGNVLNFIAVVIVSLIIFLLFNRYPAKVFMGDTGSLSLGALFAALAVVYGNPYVLLYLGTVYAIETMSVIIQVCYYKLKQERVFLMTPIHHHFEMMGLSERKVVLLFLFIQIPFFLILLMKWVI